MYAMTAAHPTLPIPSYARVTNLANGRSVIVRINDRGPFHPGRVIDLSFAAAYRLGYANVGSINVEVERILPRDIALGHIPPTTGPSPATLVGAVVPAPTVSPTTLSVVAPAVAMQGPPASPKDPSLAAQDSQRNALLLAELPPDLLPDDLVAAGSRRGPTPPSAVVAVSKDEGFFIQVGAFSTRRGAEDFLAHLAREIDSTLASQLRVLDGATLYRVRLGPYVDRNGADAAVRRLHDDLNVTAMVVVPAGCARDSSVC
jgi:rare lipoprotein A